MEESCMERTLNVNKKNKHLVHKPTRLKPRYCTVKLYISFRNLWMDQRSCIEAVSLADPSWNMSVIFRPVLLARNSLAVGSPFSCFTGSLALPFLITVKFQRELTFKLTVGTYGLTLAFQDLNG